MTGRGVHCIQRVVVSERRVKSVQCVHYISERRVQSVQCVHIRESTVCTVSVSSERRV